MGKALAKVEAIILARLIWCLDTGCIIDTRSRTNRVTLLAHVVSGNAYKCTKFRVLQFNVAINQARPILTTWSAKAVPLNSKDKEMKGWVYLRGNVFWASPDVPEAPYNEADEMLDCLMQIEQWEKVARTEK